MYDLFCIIPFQKLWRPIIRKVAVLVETAIHRNAYCTIVLRYVNYISLESNTFIKPLTHCFELLFTQFHTVVKDVIRLLKMVHGTSSEHLLWPMIRYAQESGNDAVCKAIMMKHLGEPNAPDVLDVVSQNEDIVTTRRDVGPHAKTVVQLLELQLQDGKDVTMAMLVKEWRSTGASAHGWYVVSEFAYCVLTDFLNAIYFCGLVVV